MNTRIVELIIDDNLDEFGGIDGVALVARPAHEENWMTFNTALDTCCDTELKNIFEVLDDDKLTELGRLMGELGEPDGILEADGYELVSIKPIRDKYDFSVGDYAKPNEKSGTDSIGSDRIRYKYVGPRDKKNRTFCAQMMTANRVYRIEDIQEMTQVQANAEFGYYDIFKWRGSFNCRHFWVELTYKPTGTIINKSSVRKGLVSDEIYAPQERTITNRTANAWEREGKSTEIYNPGRFTMAEESYNDYPEAASENACRVLRWIDEYGRNEVSGMELTGLARANQLCKKEPISRETIARMASFNRHRGNSEIAPEYKGTPWKDKGYVAWLGWGGTEGVDWAMRKLEQIDTEMSKVDDDKEMVDGIVELLLKVDDLDNRIDIVKDVIDDFDLEGVIYDRTDFLRRLGITTLAVVGERGGIKESPKAPKSDTPNRNPKGEGTAKGSASSTRGAKVSEEVETILKEKSDDFNERYKDKLGYGVNVGMLKAVYQRGVGAYNVSHSPAVKSSQQWALARVNAFLYMVKEGRPENKKYTGDFDLLPTKHPKKVEMEIDTTGLSPYTDEIGKKKKPTIIENFSGEKHAFSLDDDKMEITGAAIVPQKFIIRVNEFNQPYYVFFSMETTKLLAQKFMKDNINNSTNIEHTNKSAKAFVSESWIVEDPDNDKSNALGLNYPQGTWVITMKVQDAQLWKDIKAGKYKGFSVEGFFSEKLIFNDIQNK